MNFDNIQAVLFDLDGTLTDSAPGILGSMDYMLEKMGKTLPDGFDRSKLLGPPLSYSMKYLIGFDDEDAAEAIKLYRSRYGEIGLFENKPYDGIAEMLEALKGAGLRLAVATNKPEAFAVRILERYGLIGYFDTVCGSGLSGERDTKAEVVTEALARLGVTEPERAVMVGDRKYDAEGARQAGLECIGALWGYAGEGELEGSGAAALAASPAELAGLFIG
ncbi:MAG: HAD-IA family hydrolase [Ruminococcus sp.]|nr:HAD-IA family hydrolase [Ruminococcus sp.]